MDAEKVFGLFEGMLEGGDAGAQTHVLGELDADVFKYPHHADYHVGVVVGGFPMSAAFIAATPSGWLFSRQYAEPLMQRTPADASLNG